MARKSRKIPKERMEQDLTVPLTAFELGSSKDPCFGKLYSIKAKECKMCGDFEACSIQTLSKMHKQIESEESKAKFRDTEEAEFLNEKDKEIASIMLRRAKKKDGWCSIEKLLPKLRKVLNLTEKENPNITQRAIRAAQKSGLKLNNQLTKYKV